MTADVVSIADHQTRAAVAEALRRLLPKLEGIRGGALPFGITAIDASLPQGGLAFAAMHEVVPASDGDLPAAFGFATALIGRMPQGPILIVTAKKFASLGDPYGHGLNRLGLDPARVILIETKDDQQALWAMEEALRSAVPAAVAGTIGARLDLKASQRLHLAAKDARIPLILLRPAKAVGASAAATRWRIGTAEAARDRFGLFAGSRWRVSLERCRNGRPGEWVLELDHAYRFSLAAALADSALPCRAGALPGLRTGRS